MLFRSRGINEIFDQLEKLSINFRVLELHIGQSLDEDTSAFLQIFSTDDEKFLQAVDAIYEIGERHKLKITE